MPEVRFDEEVATRSYGPATSTKGLSKWLVTNGYAKTERSANTLLIGIAVVGILGAFAFYFLMPKQQGSLTPEQKALLEASTPRPAPVYH